MNKVLFIFIFIFLPLFVFGTDKININTAPLKELENITGVGPVLAQRIIEARPYSSIDDLDKVKGVGPKILEKIKTQGLVCTNCETEISTITTPNITTTTSPSEVDVAPIIYPGGVMINEILPNPEGADETEEWVEIYNQNNFDVDLSGWKIKDIMGTVTTFIIPQSTKISANGFLTFKRLDTKIMLNNDSDGLGFYNPNEKIIDTISYAKAPLGQSYNKINSGWAWSLTLTPDKINIITTAQEKNSKTLPKIKKTVKNNIVEAGLSDLSSDTKNNQEEKNENNPWFLFCTVLTITIVSALIILFIKIKLQKNVRT
jgi:competence ComEA-like helix-hairpin-helix protein